MKAKQIAVILMTTTMALSTAGATSVLADPSGMNGRPNFSNSGPEFGNTDRSGFSGSEAPDMPNFDNSQVPSDAPAMPDSGNGQAPSDAPAMPDSGNGQAPSDEAQTPDDQTSSQTPNCRSPKGMQQNGRGRSNDADGNGRSMVKVTSVSGSDVTVEIRNMIHAETAGDKSTGTQESDAETKTISLSDSIKVYKQSGRNEKTEASVNDISSDTMLEIEYDTDGTTVKSVTIKDKPEGMENGRNGMRQEANAPATPTAAEPTTAA